MKNKSRSAIRQRKLHRGHFAFMRAVVQGVDLRESWDRYIRLEGEHTDVRAVRSTIAWIRGEFAAAARRERRHGAARLVLIDATTVDNHDGDAPSLEEFAYARGLGEFSEADQLAAYAAEHGTASGKQSRRGKLIERQLKALQWLESLVAEPPRSGDAIASWMHPLLVDKLESAGLYTLSDLIARINGVGKHWARHVRGIGTLKAERIVEWLKEHEATLGCRLGAHLEHHSNSVNAEAFGVLVETASDIRPLEKFRPPPELDGSMGAYRCPPEKCLLKANNDYEAILVWLRAKPGPSPQQMVTMHARKRGASAAVEVDPLSLGFLSNTQRSYRKEAERFLLWAILVQGKALSSMSLEDCIAYREFLADPQPHEVWCGHRSHERWSPLWRPFEGPLSPAAQRQAVVILRNLYNFLVSQSYLMGNPWSGVSVPISPMPQINAGRSFSAKQWAFVEEQLNGLPESSNAHRLRVAARLLYATGLRLSEVVAARTDDLRWVEYPPDSDDGAPLDGWMLTVLGKGQRLREVPVPVHVVEEISRYLAERGLNGDLTSTTNRGTYLLGKSYDWEEKVPQLAAGRGAIDPKDGIAAVTLARQLKRFFQECAIVLENSGDSRGAARFEKASTHWMRHTHASHAIAQGMPIEIAQQNLGHASLATTTIYVTTEKKRRMRASMKIFSEKE
ncbi:site-specific integrase [Azoarcus sp. KH32C]|uniref:site-specific integrase n=1 Tax=Azoarcus sp. KH32C TaxID=748247 RepID=UPI0002385BBB|nr:site-specific integrase [Azoarcus sp. KH32C]BAL27310.1 int, tyrosine-based site-specific recombinase [Azoarcus sp. KH32C]